VFYIFAEGKGKSVLKTGQPEPGAEPRSDSDQNIMC